MQFPPRRIPIESGEDYGLAVMNCHFENRMPYASARYKTQPGLAIINSVPMIETKMTGRLSPPTSRMSVEGELSLDH